MIEISSEGCISWQLLMKLVWKGPILWWQVAIRWAAMTTTTLHFHGNKARWFSQTWSREVVSWLLMILLLQLLPYQLQLLPYRLQLLLYRLHDHIDHGSIDCVTIWRWSKNFWKRMVLLHSWINLQAAIGLEQNEFGSESAQRKKARLHFLVAQVLLRSTSTIWSTLM